MDNINNKTLGIDHKASGVVDVMYITDMYEAYGTYVDDKYLTIMTMIMILMLIQIMILEMILIMILIRIL